jgi:TrmH family RNA methyltransferase
MSGKQHLRFIQSLLKKKIRQENQLFVAEGAKIVPELIRENFSIQEIIALPTWLEEQADIISHLKIKISPVTLQEMQLASQLVTPQPVLAVCNIPVHIATELKEKEIVLYLDAIRDPGNLGTILRLADWFGLTQIWHSPDTVDWTNPKVIQASMGSFIRVKMIEVERHKINSYLPEGTPIYAADIQGENLFTADFSPYGVIVLGNEANGLTDEVIPLITQKLTIPTFSKNLYHAESLNVSTAAALTLGEFKRRSTYSYT